MYLDIQEENPTINCIFQQFWTEISMKRSKLEDHQLILAWSILHQNESTNLLMNLLANIIFFCLKSNSR